MTVGDELYFTDSLYHEMIGRFVSAVELLNKRIRAKDDRILEIEKELAAVKQELADTLNKKVVKK